MFKFIICRIKGHTLTRAGSCPFTGNIYDVCERCLNTFKVELLEIKPDPHETQVDFE